MTTAEATTRCKTLVLDLRKAGLSDAQIGTAMLVALGENGMRTALAASPVVAAQIASGLRAVRRLAEIARQIEGLSGHPPASE